MSKIVQAVNAMISNPKLISLVNADGRSVFFLYKGKYKWSIVKYDNDTHMLWYFPGNQTIQALAKSDANEWENFDKVAYSDEEIGTKEAKASFSELYTTVSERRFGLNEVLDDIISDEDIPF